MIYLLKLSPHNEDFILEGYATNDEEISCLARNEIINRYGFIGLPINNVVAIINHTDKTVEVRWQEENGIDESITLYLVSIPKIESSK
jgi:hypothetical protein